MFSGSFAFATTHFVQLAPRQLDLFGRLSRPASVPASVPVELPKVVEPEAPAPLLKAVPVSLPQVAERPPTRQETLARARAMAARIAEILGPELKVLLTVHDNRSTMISFRRQPPLLKIRAHHMFLEAPVDAEF